jgi:uncharacterized protein DUF3618
VDQDPRTAGPPVDEPRSPAQIQADIERTREEVGDTVEALAAKTDVKARAQERVNEVKAQMPEKVRQNPMPLIGAGALLLAFLIGRRSARP